VKCSSPYQQIDRLGLAKEFPCGRCLACRINRAEEWSTRLQLELEDPRKQGDFVTLTFDDQKSCVLLHHALSKRVLQNFFKRLRKGGYKIKYFACGEYGEKLFRPHYHAIIFGHSFSDKVPVSGLSTHDSNVQRFHSDELTRLWGKGKTELGNVAFDSAAYVANYATKKITGPSAAEHYKGRTPEFLLMSRRPGIAYSWFKKYSSDVYPADEVIIRGQETKPPRYYDQIGLVKCLASTAKILDNREARAQELETVNVRHGLPVEIAPSRNARRLAVREKVASAKFALKKRNMENEK